MSSELAEADLEAGEASDGATEPEPAQGMSAQLLAFVKVVLLLWTAPFRVLLGATAQPAPTLVGPAAEPKVWEEEAGEPEEAAE